MNWKRTATAGAMFGALAGAATVALQSAGLDLPASVAVYASAGGFGSLALLHVIALVIGPEKTSLDETAARIEDGVINAAKDLLGK